MITPHALGGSDGEALDRDTAQLFRYLSGLERAFLFRDRNSICYRDLTAPQYFGLEALDRHGPLTADQLSEHLLVARNTITATIRQLERSGLAELFSHEEEQVLIFATEEGRELVRQVERDGVVQGRWLLMDFEQATRAAIVELLQRVEVQVSRHTRIVNRDPLKGAPLFAPQATCELSAGGKNRVGHNGC